MSAEYTLRFVIDGEQEDADEKYNNEVSLIMRLLDIINYVQTKSGFLGYRLKVMKKETTYTELKGDE